MKYISSNKHFKKLKDKIYQYSIIKDFDILEKIDYHSKCAVHEYLEDDSWNIADEYKDNRLTWNYCFFFDDRNCRNGNWTTGYDNLIFEMFPKMWLNVDCDNYVNFVYHSKWKDYFISNNLAFLNKQQNELYFMLPFFSFKRTKKYQDLYDFLKKNKYRMYAYQDTANSRTDIQEIEIEVILKIGLFKVENYSVGETIEEVEMVECIDIAQGDLRTLSVYPNINLYYDKNNNVYLPSISIFDPKTNANNICYLNDFHKTTPKIYICHAPFQVKHNEMWLKDIFCINLLRKNVIHNQTFLDLSFVSYFKNKTFDYFVVVKGNNVIVNNLAPLWDKELKIDIKNFWSIKQNIKLNKYNLEKIEALNNIKEINWTQLKNTTKEYVWTFQKYKKDLEMVSNSINQGTSFSFFDILLTPFNNFIIWRSIKRDTYKDVKKMLFFNSHYTNNSLFYPNGEIMELNINEEKSEFIEKEIKFDTTKTSLFLFWHQDDTIFVPVSLHKYKQPKNDLLFLTNMFGKHALFLREV